ncbi:MAG: LPS export ABC transporter ATP-binding protein [Flavobacteriales bacterium]|jgi:lipopolysaccharide export system ATP-binding protein|nr:LPS export ABC transporter ATP-binding protein [Flavobacteriales bacterium]MBT3572572.1 LPS export ABC transporter ATP-binding protein [Flavobacteriales bacterium]MBT3678304.1 LPS export ABC transporter ATP-binding protein [Flavobacteriales bacterium]MBT3739598.1 LPS export ABC transporter ATP-binding protein [Flavobacteriales bacterium]MBT4102311.1 LPS export ABC transporter ATP-binding protein [Flavobacteriales bacterium]
MSLSVNNITKVYKRRAVVDGVSFNVSQGEIVGLLGPNGAGKTTSFYAVVGMVKADKGTIILDGMDITRMPMHQRAKHGIGYLAQEPSIFRKMTVEDNVAAVFEWRGFSKADIKAKTAVLLDEFGLSKLANHRGDLLSGGERRRAEIARCLASDPRFILLDEPFAGVDPIAVEDIQHIVSRLVDRNIGVLITDHNVQETLAITDRTYLMFEGKILKHGSAEELAADPVVRKVYLGQNFKLRPDGRTA